jgi:hypothetical protein
VTSISRLALKGKAVVHVRFSVSLNRSWMLLACGSSNCTIYTTRLLMWVGLPHSQLSWWPDRVFWKPWWLKPVCFQGQVHSDKQMYSDSITTYVIFKKSCNLSAPFGQLTGVSFTHHTSHGLWFTMFGVNFSKCSMKMILNYWKQKEHHGCAIHLMNIHLRVGKHSTVALTCKKYYSASMWSLWNWFLITSSTGILMKIQKLSKLII